MPVLSPSLMDRTRSSEAPIFCSSFPVRVGGTDGGLERIGDRLPHPAEKPGASRDLRRLDRALLSRAVLHEPDARGKTGRPDHFGQATHTFGHTEPHRNSQNLFAELGHAGK